MLEESCLCTITVKYFAKHIYTYILTGIFPFTNHNIHDKFTFNTNNCNNQELLCIRTITKVNNEYSKRDKFYD